MNSYIEGHEDASSVMGGQGQVPQPPNDVEPAANAKPLKINPKKVFTALRNLRIDRSRIKPLDTGSSANNNKEGGFGVVIPAVLDPDTSSDNAPTLENSNFVAVKKLHYGENANVNRVLAQFALEIKILSDLSHQNVASLIGFVEEAAEEVAWMVFRWEKKGNLREFVRSAKWELPERVSLVHDVAQGLVYLHERQPPICHGDLKSLNILVNDEHRAMITDFGSARTVDSHVEEPATSPAEMDNESPGHSPAQQPGLERLIVEFDQIGSSLNLTGPAWSTRWAAPELFLREGALPSLASDIWALAWIFWEAITGNFPFEEVKREHAVVFRIASGKLPALDTDAKFVQIKALCSLMVDCWSFEPKGRPSARACQQRLSFMSQSIPSKDPGSRSCELLWALGRFQYHNFNHSEAAKYFREAKDAAESAEDWRGFAQCVKGLGDVHQMRSQESEAEEAYITARNVFSQIGSQRGFAECVRSLGEVYRMREEYREAEEAYIEAGDVFSQTGSQLGFAQCVQSLGEVYRMQKKYSEAGEAFIKGRDVFSAINNQLGFAQCVRGLGNVYQAQNKYLEAEEAYIEARDVFSQIGDRMGFAQCVQNLGAVYRMRNEYSEAEEAYNKARDVFGTIGDPLGLAQCLQGLGGAYAMRDEYAEAEEAYIKARDVFGQIGSQLGFARCVQSLGHLHQARDKYSEAEEAYIEARDVFSQAGDQLGRAQCDQGLGDAHLMREQYAEAEDAYIKARDVFSRIGNQLGFARAAIRLAQIHWAREEYSKAKDHFTEAREVMFRLGHQDLVTWLDGELASLLTQFIE